MNLYASLGELKAAIKATGTSSDAELLRLLEQVSRAVDDWCDRQFYAVQDTRYFDGGAEREFWFPHRQDLAAVTSIGADVDGDGVYELSPVLNTDYFLWPDSPRPGEPYVRLDINPYSSILSVWPCGRRRLKVSGTFGFPGELRSAGTISGALDDSATSITMNAGHGLTGGETVVIGTERVYVSGVVGDTLTVERGVNGSTAAGHSDGDAVARVRFPMAVERAVLMQAARFYRESQGAYAGEVGGAGMGGFAFNSTYPAIRDLLAPYRLPGVA